MSGLTIIRVGIFERELLAYLARQRWPNNTEFLSITGYGQYDDVSYFLANYVGVRPHEMGIPPSTSFSILINSVVDSIMGDECHCINYERTRNRALRTLCYWAFKNRDAVYFNSDLVPMPLVDHHCFVAAIYPKKFSFIHHILDKKEIPVLNMNSELWGCPLHAAIEAESPSLVRLLLLSGATPEPQLRKVRHSCLECAIRSKASSDMVPIFFEQLLGVSHTESNLQSSVLLAIKLGKEEIANILLSIYHKRMVTFHYPVRYHDGSLYKALGEACEQGMMGTVIHLLDIREKQNPLANNDCIELAFIACKHGQERILEILLQRCVVSLGHTFEHRSMAIAAIRGHVGVIRVLADAGEILNPIQAVKILCELAPRPLSSEAVRYLLQHGLINIKYLNSGFRCTATHLAHVMMVAAQHGNVDFIIALARFGAPIDDEEFYKAQDCPLPIIAAMAFSQTATVEALLQLGCKERSPLDSIVARRFKSGKYPCPPPRVGPEDRFRG